MAAPDGIEMTEAGRQYLDRLNQWWTREGAYVMLQSTKPQSVGAGLNDSPAGPAAWTLSFGGKDGATFERSFGSRDELLINITLYGGTQTITSAARLYYEGAHDGEHRLHPAPRIEAPAAVALFPGEEIPRQEWVAATINLRRWTEMSGGGHFAALQAPHSAPTTCVTFFSSV
jgi:hypothetical protein